MATAAGKQVTMPNLIHTHTHYTYITHTSHTHITHMHKYTLDTHTHYTYITHTSHTHTHITHMHKYTLDTHTHITYTSHTQTHTQSSRIIYKSAANSICNTSLSLISSRSLKYWSLRWIISMTFQHSGLRPPL